MASNQIINVCRFFAEKQINIPSSNEWLIACIQWFVSENPESNTEEIQKFAYDQLLLADLNVVAQACLPQNINDCHTIKLPGKYFLQINYFIDVGQSAYSQYQKIMKRNVTNLEEDHEGHNEERRYWEKSPNRMLKMEMTDGVHTVFGMEYSSISKLNSNTLIPGIKVLVKGPIECRSGVMMLQENNIDLLGGEVDSLFEDNHTNRLIARKLNVDENLVPLEEIDNEVPPVINSVQPPEQNIPFRAVTHSSNNGRNLTLDNLNMDNSPRGTQENISQDFFEDSDVFLSVPVDHLLNENENTNSCEPTGNKVMEIEASVVTFKSKLLINDDNWSLKVKLNTSDGTLNASFDSDLLDRLIGFSPSELSSREAEISVNPAIKEKMDSMLKRSQQLIKNLKCVMTLAQNEGDELPIIIAISDESAFCNFS